MARLNSTPVSVPRRAVDSMLPYLPVFQVGDPAVAAVLEILSSFKLITHSKCERMVCGENKPEPRAVDSS